MRAVGMLVAAPILGLAAVACGSGRSQPAQTAAHSSPASTPSPSLAPSPSPSPSTLSLPSDPCQWLLESDAQQLLGVAINTRVDGATNCSYSPGTLEETASPAPGAADGAS